MGSGAYAVVIDPPANLAFNTAFARCVPLPPAGNTGAVKYEPVYLSLAVAPGVAVPLTVSVTLIRTGGPQILGPFTFTSSGRQGVCKVSPGDLAAEIGFTPSGAPATAVAAVTAFVEYGTP
jgi:hypothetical protein